MVPIRLLGASAALFLSSVCVAAPQLPEGTIPGWEDALARYKEVMGRKPFRMHTEGRSRIAETRSPEALPILATDYAKPQAYPEHTKYTIATLLGRHFDRLADLSAIAALRRGHTKPIDTWLWVQALRLEIDRNGPEEALAIVRDDKDVHHRAAAIAAIGSSSRPELKEALVPVCMDFPKKEFERNLLIGAMTGALWENRKRINEEGYRAAIEAYIGLLATDVGLGHTIKVQMARHLQEIFDSPAMWVNPEPWLEILQRGEVKQKKDNETTAGPSFFGVTTDGERFVYVVDMSDSMLKPIEPSAKPDNVPTTGPRKKPKKKKILDESDLPWHEIHTRWDLAREQLIISLSRLTPDKHFAVVWFGTETGTLKSTKGMVKATSTNVKRVVDELKSIQQEPLDASRGENSSTHPDGKLKGETNLHGGLRLAFALADKGFVEEPAYVDEDAITEGCDTIFVVTDGRPSSDDFVVADKDYGEGKVVRNRESNAEAPRSPTLLYHGPYVADDWLLADVARMNSFRRIRLYAIGIGEANMRLLEELAKIGNGEAFSFGKKQKQD